MLYLCTVTYSVSGESFGWIANSFPEAKYHTVNIPTLDMGLWAWYCLQSGWSLPFLKNSFEEGMSSSSDPSCVRLGDTRARFFNPEEWAKWYCSTLNLSKQKA